VKAGDKNPVADEKGVGALLDRDNVVKRDDNLHKEGNECAVLPDKAHTHTQNNQTKEAYGGVPEDVGVKAHVSLCYVEAALEEDLSLKGSRVVGNDDLVRRKKDLETALE